MTTIESMIKYTPPATEDLQRLKHELGLTGEEMAELASVAGGPQWRKYTSGGQPRSVNIHILFFMAARLTLTPAELRRVARKMLEMGAELDPEEIAKKFEKSA